MRKLIIAGSRDFGNYQLLVKEVEKLDFIPDQIISGCARGADSLGERYAAEKNIELVKVPADWNLYGKSAGYKRNQAMAEIATDCIVFRIGGLLSKGSTHMINIAQSKGLNTIIVEITEKNFIEIKYLNKLFGKSNIFKVIEQVSKYEQALLRSLLEVVSNNKNEWNMCLDGENFDKDAYNLLMKIIDDDINHIVSASFITTQEKNAV